MANERRYRAERNLDAAYKQKDKIATKFCSAVEKGDTQGTLQGLKLGIPVNERICWDTVSYPPKPCFVAGCVTEHGWSESGYATPLYTAKKAKNDKMTDFLIKRGATVVEGLDPKVK